ncbi:MAG: methyltransferase [Pedobacter sp.]|nr:MAG: methyltransferase [Pedobacter sp.]
MERRRINPTGTLSKVYFEQMYSKDKDPWKFETSEYERLKYDNTIQNIPEGNYASGLEIGCSIGVLTAMLPNKCKSLIAIDISTAAIDVAKERLGKNANVEFRTAAIPQDYPEGQFDLIIMSEVGYYLSLDDLIKSRERIFKSLNKGGVLVLVHWIHFVADYPLNGDQVHECFLESDLKHLHGYRESDYRLDVFQK